tara:strand:+ start:98 stop:361 length:264 start_codon:yes stop_codon:yes gene_type:complete
MKLCEVRDTCQDCGRKGILEPHCTFGPDPDNLGDEKIEALEYLCKDCHKARHTDPNGEVWGDVQEMNDSWYGYFKESEKDISWTVFS